MNTSMPICFYPLRKMILDDDQAFTKSVLLNLYGKNFVEFNSPEKALKYLSNEYRPFLTKNDLITLDNISKNLATHHSVNIHIEKLKNGLKNFPSEDIDVLLVDYHMPEMTGVDFLNSITHLPIKKVLITGEDDYTIAIDAFNNGLVDAYIKKNEKDFLIKLKNIVNELEWKYFTELSHLVTEIPDQDLDYIRNDSFIQLFRKIIQEHSIIAFSIVDLQGTFILLDKKRASKCLVVRSKTQLKYLSKIAQEDGASKKVVAGLDQANIIPYFREKAFWEIPASMWDKYLYPAKNIPKESELVWTIIYS